MGSGFAAKPAVAGPRVKAAVARQLEKLTPEQRLAAVEAAYYDAHDADDSDESYNGEGHYGSESGSVSDSEPEDVDSDSGHGEEGERDGDGDEEGNEEGDEEGDEGGDEGDDEEGDEDDDDNTKKTGLRGRRIGNIKSLWINDPGKAELRRRAGVKADLSEKVQDKLMRALRKTVKAACKESCEHTMTWYMHHNKWNVMVDSESFSLVPNSGSGFF